MQAAVYRGPGQVAIENVTVPNPGPGEVIVRVEASGVCGTDGAEYQYGAIMTRAMADGGPHPASGQALPVVLGHEFAGTITEVGAGVDRSRIGDLVTCGAGVSCGVCPNCLAGRTNLCRVYFTLGYHRNGGLAEYVAAPLSTLVSAGSLGLTSDAAGLGQPMSVAVHAVRRGDVRAGQSVVVVGIGGIGAFIAHAAAAEGANVLAVDVVAQRLELARQLGAHDTLLSEPGQDLRDALAQRGVHPDVIFEVTGRAQVLRECIAVMAPGTRLVMVGIQKGLTELELGGVSLTELDLVGTVAHVCGRDLPRALEILAARSGGWGDVAPVVRPLSELQSHGLIPLAAGTPLEIKTLFDPRVDHVRAATY
jgi:(R,R)-butanediol dehydrogenase/meso-butanediol dehydrogenase/diacetyl reductase